MGGIYRVYHVRHRGAIDDPLVASGRSTSLTIQSRDC